MRHLVIGQRQKAPNFSAFHWSPHGCLITIGQHFVTTRVVRLPKRTETSLMTESDQSRANHQQLQLCTVRIAWSDSDQAVRAVHSCKSWYSNKEYSWLVCCFGFNGPLRQYFSLYQAVSQRGGERVEKRIDESENVHTTPTRTYYKHSRPLPYFNPNCRTPRLWKFRNIVHVLLITRALRKKCPFAETTQFSGPETKE